MDGKGWRSIQDFPWYPPPQVTSLLGVPKFGFPSTLITRAESPLSAYFCLQVPYSPAYKSKFWSKSFLDTDEGKITWEGVCQQSVCTSLLISYSNSPAKQPFSSQPDSLLINFISGGDRVAVRKGHWKAQDFPEESKGNRAEGFAPGQGIELHI